MFGFTEKMFIELLSFTSRSLTSVVNDYDHTKHISRNNQHCMT